VGEKKQLICFSVNYGPITLRYSQRNQFPSKEAPRTGFLTILKAAFFLMLSGTGLSLQNHRDAEK